MSLLPGPGRGIDPEDMNTAKPVSQNARLISHAVVGLAAAVVARVVRRPGPAGMLITFALTAAIHGALDAPAAGLVQAAF